MSPKLATAEHIAQADRFARTSKADPGFVALFQVAASVKPASSSF